MVTVILEKDFTGNIREIEVSGHANQGKYGQDIVCSAISVLTISTLNGLTDVAKAKVDYKVEEGYTKIVMLEALDEKSDAILKTYELGIEALLEDYGKYLQLVKKEVQLDD